MPLSTQDLRIEVDKKQIVSSLSISFAAKEMWAVLGPNGVGKSLLLHTLAGLRSPARGEVRLDGKALDRWDRRDFARRVGVLLQDEPSDFWGTLGEYVALGRIPHGDYGRPASDRLTHEAIAALDLSPHTGQLYRSLSGGERQRARIAQLLLQDPDTLLLDEPLNHLDLRHQTSVMRLLDGLAARGKSVVCTIHDPAWAAAACSHALLLYDHPRIEQGRSTEVVTHPALEALYRVKLAAARLPSGTVYFPDPR